MIYCDAILFGKFLGGSGATAVTLLTFSHPARGVTPVACALFQHQEASA
jgi:hypothetical protein